MLWLPLWPGVLNRVCAVIRDEQDRAVAIEILMPAIQSADLWRESGRYEAYGKEMLRISDRHDREMLFGPTAEEVVTEIFRGSVRSYKDLPKEPLPISRGSSATRCAAPSVPCARANS